MSTTVRAPIGRDEELGAITRLLDDPAQLPATVVLWGDAGIGKTSIWLAGLEAAAERGYRTLSTRPSEAEARLSYAGLADLLSAVAGVVLPELPPIQQRALEGALLLGASEAPVDERAIGAAFLQALRVLAATGPVCLAVDDLQWLDPPSLGALQFALTRLGDHPVGALVTVRGDVPPWLRRSFPEPGLEEVEVTGLSVGAMQQLLHTRLGASFPRPTLLRLWDTSGGNPFFALELAGALERRGGTLAPGDELPIPDDLDALLRERLDALGRPARDVARVVAAVAEPTTDLVEAVLGGQAEAGLSEALDARIVDLNGARLRFTHPLLGSAVVARQTPTRRRALHARLAEVVPTREQQARHLALATDAPDRAVAATIEEAARLAKARGTPATAAELAEQALRLTPPRDVTDRRRRVFLAADRHHAAGDIDRALALLRDALAMAAPGAARGELLLQIADVLFDDEPREAERLYAEALLEAQGNDVLEASLQIRLADTMRWGAGIDQGVVHATLAVQAASRTDDVELRCGAIASQADWRFRAGHGVQRAEMEEAVALERRLPGWPLMGGPTEYLCHQLVWAFDLGAARDLNLELVAVRRAQNDPANEAWALWNLGLLEWRAGNWDEAERHTADSVALRTQLGRVSYTNEFPSAIVAAHRGRIDDAREWSHRAIARGTLEGVRIEESGHSWVLGLVELSLGDAASALPYLRRSYEIRNTFMLEPAQRLELGDLLEALVAVGELDEAEAILDLWEPRAAAVDRAWARGDPRPLPRSRACGPRRRRRRALGVRGRVRRSRPRARPVPPCANRARARSDPAPRQEARRREGDARGRPLEVRGARRTSLGRTGPRRARAHRRSRPVARRPDGGRATRRDARRRGPVEQAGRGRAVPDRALGRDGPHARLPKARRSLQDGARTTSHGDGLRGLRSQLR